jgi:hypothetical protein
MRSLASFLLALAAATAVVVLGLLLIRGESGWFGSETRTSSVSIVEQIKLVAKLQTVEYHGTTTVRKNKEHAFGKSSVLYLAEGKVTASVDLEQMQIQVVDAARFLPSNDSARKVRLTLPEVVIDDPVIKRFEILMSCESFVAPELTDDERNSLHREVLGRLKVAAQEDGIRGKARKQAEDYLRTFLTALGYTVEFA